MRSIARSATFTQYESKSHEGDGSDVKYRWRKYCGDGSQYGIYPEDYETADDYVEALEMAKMISDSNLGE